MIGHHLQDKLRIARLPKAKWAAEVAKLSDEARAEVAPWLRIEWEKSFYADQIKESARKRKAHDALVQDTKRKKR